MSTAAPVSPTAGAPDTAATHAQQRTLLVVDWSPGAAQDLQQRLQALPRAQGSDNSASNWDVMNCPATPQASGPGRRGIAKLGLALRYLGTACTAAWRSRDYAQVVVWQQVIGYILCVLPRWPRWLSRAMPGGPKMPPRLVITTVLISPSAAPPRSVRRAVLRLALWRADALVYFSREMAQDTARHHPRQAHKVFWTPLPRLGEGPPEPQASRAGRAPLTVFAGGSSERDFDVVIRAFRGSDVPVTLVCREDEVFAPPGPVGPQFSVHREVSHARFEALVLQAEVAVVALKSGSSGCGQLLFTFCMRHGIAVIATDCYGTRDYVVPEETGLLVPAGDAAALRRAYDRLAADPGLRSKLIEQARARSAHWGLAGFVESIEQVAQTLHKPK